VDTLYNHPDSYYDHGLSQRYGYENVYSIKKKELKKSGDFFLNKPTTITVTITPPVDIQSFKFNIGIRNAILVSGKESIISTAKANVPQHASYIIKPISTPFIVSIFAGGTTDSCTLYIANIHISEILVDTSNGRLGSWEELRFGKNANLLLFSSYNYSTGEWLSKPDKSQMGGNNLIIKKIREFEPSITDSEALCLHSDWFKIGLPRNDEFNKKPVRVIDGTENAQYRFYLVLPEKQTIKMQ
jgi:hypothetical protein